MKIYNVALCIHPHVEQLEYVKNTISSFGDKIFLYQKNNLLKEFEKNKIDFIISYGYKFLFKEPTLSIYKNRLFNLHPSYLPYGRGYYPNFWSFIKNTPKGVTIHNINKGVDTGNIIFQKEHFFDDNQTLKDTYYILQNSMLKLFHERYKLLRNNNFVSIEQNLDSGTTHKEKDFLKVFPIFKDKFNTKIKEVIERKGEVLNMLRNK